MEILGWLALLVPLLWFTVFSLFCFINPFGGVQDKIENVMSFTYDEDNNNLGNFIEELKKKKRKKCHICQKNCDILIKLICGH